MNPALLAKSLESAWKTQFPKLEEAKIVNEEWAR